MILDRVTRSATESLVPCAILGVRPLWLVIICPFNNGMTVGELAMLFARDGKLDITPTVIPVRGWKHSDLLH